MMSLYGYVVGLTEEQYLEEAEEHGVEEVTLEVTQPDWFPYDDIVPKYVIQYRDGITDSPLPSRHASRTPFPLVSGIRAEYIYHRAERAASELEESGLEVAIQVTEGPRKYDPKVSIDKWLEGDVPKPLQF